MFLHGCDTLTHVFQPNVVPRKNTHRSNAQLQGWWAGRRNSRYHFSNSRVLTRRSPISF